MSLGSPVIRARLALRGTLQFRDAEGRILKEVEIVDGALPLVQRAADPIPVTEPHHGPGPA